MSASEQSIAAPTSAPKEVKGVDYKYWSQDSQNKAVAQAKATANWTGDKFKQGATATKEFSIAAAKLTGNFLVEFHKQHKTSGIIFMIVALSIFVTAVVDISAVSSNGYLKWDSSVTAEQAAHRDRSITTLVFAIILFLFMIVKEFNYFFAKIPKIGGYLEM